jgi:hypothetical protein
VSAAVRVFRPFRLERDIERAFREECQVRGYLTLKLNGSGRRGWPDRLLLLVPRRQAHVVFVELKLVGKRPTSTQAQVLLALRTQGFRAELWHPRDRAELRERFDRLARELP